VAVQPGLGVPENARATVRAAAGAFATYERQLLADLEWFDGEVLSISSLENFCNRVRRVAEALGEEAKILDRRAQLRDAAAPEPVPLLGVAVEGDRGLELKPFSLDETIEQLVAVQKLAYSVIPPALVPEGHEDYPEARE
jgi:hypothetical protein